MKTIKVILALLVLCGSGKVFAQKNYTKQANKLFNHGLYVQAIEAFKEASGKESKKPKKAELIFKTAECYRMLNDSRNAEAWYKKAIAAKYPDPIAVLYMADAKKTQERYADAIVDYNEYAKMVPSDNRGKDGATSCELAQKWKDNPTRYQVNNIMSINSKWSDFAPAYADKKQNLIFFTSTREGSGGNKPDNTTGQSFSDIYETRLDKKGTWSTPMPVPDPVNTKLNEGSAQLNKKRGRMWFTRCPQQDKRNLGSILCETEKKGNGWAEPKILTFCADSYSVGHPSITTDEKTLFFSSDMPGGNGGKDIWYVNYDKKEGKWSDPINAGPIINTMQDEMFPFIDENGNLFFASNGHIGMGGLDIFKADKSGDAFAAPVNLQYPINSAGDDFSLITDGKMEKGYFASNRAGGKGSDDIYSFGLPPLLFTVSGTIYNVDTKEKVIGALVKMNGSDGMSVETKTDETGSYRFDVNADGMRLIKKDISYNLAASKEDFLGDKAEFSTLGMETNNDFIKDMNIKPIVKEVAIKLPDILYDLNKWDLKPEFQDSLNGLVKTLNDNMNITIELGSHTDTRGDNKSNSELAQKRAQSVVDFLISKGIAGDRLTAKGYGESMPLISDKEINALASNEEKEAAHAKNRRTTFKILRQDYVPKVDPNAPKVAPTIEDESDSE
ncbi:MAG: OmpA family protein [Bacteroidota bacterium]